MPNLSLLSCGLPYFPILPDDFPRRLFRYLLTESFPVHESLLHLHTLCPRKVGKRSGLPRVAHIHRSCGAQELPLQSGAEDRSCDSNRMSLLTQQSLMLLPLLLPLRLVVTRARSIPSPPKGPTFVAAESTLLGQLVISVSDSFNNELWLSQREIDQKRRRKHSRSLLIVFR